MKLLFVLWHDESAAVVSSEMILTMTIVVVGLIAGLTSLRDALVTELADTAGAISSLNQTFSFAGIMTDTGMTAGSLFLDQLDFCDDTNGQPIGANSRCIVLCVDAQHEG